MHAANRCAADQIPDGVFLVRVQRVYFRRLAQKPYHTLTLAILEPRSTRRDMMLTIMVLPSKEGFPSSVFDFSLATHLTDSANYLPA